MAENQFPSTVDALLKGMDNFNYDKDRGGRAVKGAGRHHHSLDGRVLRHGSRLLCPEFQSQYRGGMGARMSPSAILVIQNGMTRLVNIRHQDAMTKALDMVPDLVNRFVGGKDISPEAMEKAEDMKAGYEAEAKEEK